MRTMTIAESASRSLECPTMIKSAAREPAMAILETLSGTDCRFRSIVGFELGEAVEFDLALHGAPRIVVRGRVTSRVESGPRTICAVAIDASQSDVAADILEAAEMALRQARSRSLNDVPTGNGLTRASVRVAVTMDVEYSVSGGTVRRAAATNVSTGGMLMRANADLAVGASLDVAFKLPGTSDALRLRARIVATQPDGDLRRYNVAFHSLDAASVRAIERFVEAVTS